MGKASVPTILAVLVRVGTAQVRLCPPYVLRFARNDDAERSCARGLRGDERPRALGEEEVWGASSFHPASTRKLLTPVEDEQDQAQRQQDRTGDHAEPGVGRRLRQHDRARRGRDHRTLQ